MGAFQFLGRPVVSVSKNSIILVPLVVYPMDELRELLRLSLYRVDEVGIEVLPSILLRAEQDRYFDIKSGF